MEELGVGYGVFGCVGVEVGPEGLDVVADVAGEVSITMVSFGIRDMDSLDGH